MNCLKCNAKIKDSRLRIRPYIDCVECGARHIEVASKEKPICNWKSVASVIIWILFIMFGRQIALYFEQYLGKVISFMFVGLVGVLAAYGAFVKYRVKTEPSTFKLVEKVGPLGSGQDGKVVLVIIASVIVLGILLWQIPHPGKS